MPKEGDTTKEGKRVRCVTEMMQSRDIQWEYEVQRHLAESIQLQSGQLNLLL